jgi:hypothetical protein
MFPISESDDFVVRYDPMRGMYQVMVFDDGNFKDEYWFDAYEETELSAEFPITINGITFYSKYDMFEWIKEHS